MVTQLNNIDVNKVLLMQQENIKSSDLLLNYSNFIETMDGRIFGYNYKVSQWQKMQRDSNDYYNCSFV